MKEKTRRIIALLCAVCLLASGEGRLCLTALAAMARPASYAVDTAVEDAAVRDEAPGDAEAEPAELAENDMDSESMYYAAAGEDIAADAAAVSAEAEAVVSDVESVDNDSNTVLSNSVLTAEWDIYRVKVTYNENSGIPEDAELVVREVTENNDPNFADYLSVGAGLAGLDTDGISDESVPIAKAFDISLRSKATGEEYQPAKDMKVEISIPHYKLADNMQVSVVHFAEKLSEELQEELRQEAYAGFSDEEREVYDELSDEERDVYIGLSYEQREVYADLSEEERLVYAGLSDEDRAVYVDLSDEEREEHGYVLDDESVDDEELLTVLNSIPQLMEVDLINNTAAFTTDGFSVFVVLGYTVDFRLGEYTVEMQGGSELLLSSLLRLLGTYSVDLTDEERERLVSLADDNSAIEDVAFSDPDLMKVERIDQETAREIIRHQIEEYREAVIEEHESGELGAEDEGFENGDAYDGDLEEITEEKTEDFAEDDSEDVSEANVSVQTGLGEWLANYSDDDYVLEHDWLLTSLAPFTTDEVLTISFADGKEILVHVADAQTVTMDGFRYTIDTNRRTGVTTVTLSGRAGNVTMPVVAGHVNGFPVNKVTYDTFPLGSKAKMSEDYVELLFPNPFALKQLVKWSEYVGGSELGVAKTEVETNGILNDGVIAGVNNNTSKRKIWKESRYRVDENGDEYVDIILSYFEDQGKPIDFIFVCDETGTMANGANATVNGVSITSPRFMWARAAMLKAAKSVLAANEYSVNPYDNTVSFMVWDSNNQYMEEPSANSGNQFTSEQYKDYDAANEWLSQHYTKHGGTNHSTAISALMRMVDSHRTNVNGTGEDAIPVVVYMSDFADGGLADAFIRYDGTIPSTVAASSRRVTRNVNYVLARDLLNAKAQVYGLNMFGGNSVNDRQRKICWKGNKVAGNDPSNLMNAFTEIISDAIDNMENGMAIDDGFSDGMSSQAGSHAPASSHGDGSHDTVYHDGKLDWELNNGTASTGETLSMKTGRLYQKVTSTKITGDVWGDKAYSGSMPTNKGVELKDINGNVLNSITPEDSPKLKAPTRFVLWRMKSNETYSEKLPQISFTLTEKDDNGTEIKSHTYTTDADGAFVVPYDDFDFIVGHTYELREDAASVEAHNAANSNLIINAPDQYWVLTVDGATFQILSQVVNADTAKYTRPMAVAEGVFQIWNDEKVVAELIPITIEKEWVDDEESRRYDVPFTVYGIDPEGVEYPLKAYDGNDETTAKAVNVIKKSDPEVKVETKTVNGKNVVAWSRRVWVYDFIVVDGQQKRFYSETKSETLRPDATFNIGGKTYTYEQMLADADGKNYVSYGQTYSYRVEEGQKRTFEDGWYQVKNGKSTDTGAVKSKEIGEAWTNGTAEEHVWKEYADWIPEEELSDQFQMHINIHKFRYNDSSDDAYIEAFSKFTGHNPSHGTWTGIAVDHDTYINVPSEYRAFYNNIEDIGIQIYNRRTGEYYNTFFKISDYSNTQAGRIFKNLRLPKAWEDYPRTTYETYTDLTITQMYVVTNQKVNGQPFLVWIVGGDTTNTINYGPNYVNPLYRLAIEKLGTQNDGAHGQHTVNQYADDNSTIKIQKYYEKYDKTTTEERKFLINSLTLDMTNTWQENHLVALGIEKEWLNTPQQQIDANAPLPIYLEATDVNGNTEIIPIFAHQSWDSEKVTNIGANGVWVGIAYAQSYDTRSGDPVEYVNYVLKEGDLTVFEEQGQWKPEIEESLDTGAWTDGADYETVYVVFERNDKANPDKDYSTITDLALYFTDEAGQLYETTITGMSPGIDLRYKKIFYAQIRVPKDHDISKLEFVHGEPNNDNTYSYNTEIADGKNPFTNNGVGYYGLLMKNNGTTSRAPGYKEEGVDDEGLSSKDLFKNLRFSRTKPDDGTEIKGSTTPGTVGFRIYANHLLRIKNEFVSYHQMTMKPVFLDETGDSASTDLITSVHYTIRQGDIVFKEVDIPVSGASIGGARMGETSVYLPEGSYTVTQDSYVVTKGGDTYRIDLSKKNPYLIELSTVNGSPSLTANGGTVSVKNGGKSTYQFKNTRQHGQVKVKMAWHPTLETNEHPLNGAAPSYRLQFHNVANDTYQDVGEDTLKERETNSHETDVPSFSVLGEPFEPNLKVSDTDTSFEELLPDWVVDVIVTYETILGKKWQIYTFDCTVKCFDLDLIKSWDVEVDSSGNPTGTLPTSVTLVFERSDKKSIRFPDGTAKSNVTYTLESTNPDQRVSAVTWQDTKFDLPIIKSYEGNDGELPYYVLTETKIGNSALNKSLYEARYADGWNYTGGEADHSRDGGWIVPKKAKDSDSLYAAVSIVNKPRTTSFKIEKDWDITHLNLSDDEQKEQIIRELVQNRTVTVGLYQVEGQNSVTSYTTQSDAEAKTGKLLAEYSLSVENGWQEEVFDLPATNTYYVKELSVDGSELDSYMTTTFNPTYTYTANTQANGEVKSGSARITNCVPICKIVDSIDVTMTDDGGNTVHQTVLSDVPFRRINDAINWARNNVPMDAGHSVAIQMLVDYVIPSTDRVLLDKPTDNIIITTAATSGGTYNFIQTFSAAEGRRTSGDNKDPDDVAILKRGYNGSSLFTVKNASASMGTTKITFDGSNRAYGTDGRYAENGTTYKCDTSDGGSGHGGIISVPAGTLNLNEDSTLRNSKAVQGGAVCVKGRLTESGAKFLDNYAVGDGSTPAYGGAVCLESGAEATFRDVYIDGHSTMTIYKAGDVKDGKQLTAEEADAANRADAAAVDANADRGGGVYISANATLEFHGGELIKLRAATNGGAIDNLGKLTMTEDDQAGSAHADIEGSMEHCSATNGGAIYNGVSGTINMTGGLIHHCIAAENGGGIFTESTAVIAGKDMAIDMHTEGGKPGVISDCEAVNGNGGGIYVKAGKLDMTGGEIRGCKAIAPKNANGKVIVSVDSDTYETTCASGKGGGVYNLGTVILATASDHPGRIDNCSADFAGGGIYTTGSGSMSITGGEMDDNRAGYYGGAIYDDTIRRESDTADLLIQGIIIRGHVNLDKDTVNAQKGGAIYVANGNLDLRDRGSGESAVHTQIYDCTASENGGAIYHIFNQHIHKNSEGGRKTTLTLTDVVIDGHDKLDGSTKNARYGGAIFVFNGCDNGGSHSGHDKFKMPNGDIVKLNQFPGPNIIIDGGKIADCTADVNGGAIYCDSPVEGKGKNTISLQNGTVINGHESLGADIWNANCNDTTPNANQTNLGGGAIYFKRGTLKVGNKGDTEQVKILNCTARNFGGAVFGLPSGTNIDEDGYKYTAKLENCLIDGHAAGTTLAADDVNAGLGGGAVYMKMSTVSIENSILRNLRAPYGAAILGRTNDGGTQACTVTIDGGRIENNIATADKGGAVNAMSGLAIKDAGEDNSVDRAAAGFPVLKETDQTKWAVCTFRLEGDAVIYNNFGVGNFASQQKNLVLTRHRAETPTTEVGDTNAIINTTEDGLAENAHIGVYVTGADGMDGSAESEPYELHGGYEDDFGTYISSANLHKFTNDRNGMYGAVCTLIDGNHTRDKGHNKSEKIIRWESYLCKLTDDSGSLLFITAPGGWAGSRVIDGTTYYPAVFRTLTEAFNAMKGVAADGTSELKLYKADGNEYTIGSDIQLHMLRNYEQPGTDRPLFEADRKLTFTTAKKQANTNTGYSNGDVYIYSKGSFANADDTRATILRGENGTAGDASMLTIPDSAPTGLSLTLRNIIFDGNNYTHTGPGGIINARMGDLTVTTGSILRNAIATDKGGAIEKINGNFIMDGNAQVVNCAAQHGGGVHLEALTKCEIGGSDVIITGSKANNGCGGGIFIHSSPAVFKDKLTISDCHADVKGGGVNIGWGDASLEVESENVKILNCDANKEQEGQSSDGGGGLNIETGRNVSFGKLTISGCYTDGKGGAVRLEENATMTMNDGTIEKNKVLAGGEGAGIYVSQGSTLKLSGSPGFGSGSDANTAALDGYSTKNNGLAAYGSDTVRQDIYLAETGAESTTDEKYDPASIIVTGDITSGDSSIWVWAEDQYRYKQLMPFAKMGTGVKFAESPTDSQLDAAHLKAFRNAQDDETTENGTDTYLYGTIEGEKTDAGIIYWTGVTGSRKVILRKVGTTYTSMSGKTFNVFKGTSTLPYVVKQGTKRTQLGGTSTDTTVTVDPMTSQSSGVIWIGNLPYGWYIIEEKNPHKYFYLVVTANGTFGTPQKVTENDVVKEGGYDSLANAQAAAKALYDAKK